MINIRCVFRVPLFSFQFLFHRTVITFDYDYYLFVAAVRSLSANSCARCAHHRRGFLFVTLVDFRETHTVNCHNNRLTLRNNHSFRVFFLKQARK